MDAHEVHGVDCSYLNVQRLMYARHRQLWMKLDSESGDVERFDRFPTSTVVGEAEW